MRQRHAHEHLTRLHQRHERGEVGLRSCMGLDVGMLGAEQLLEPVDRQLLDLVHHLAPAVVAPARISLGVLVGERSAHRVDHRTAGEVLAGDQLEALRWRWSSRSISRGDCGIGGTQ